MDGTGIKWLVIGTAAAIAGLFVYKGATKAAAVAKTLATETLNPASDKNIVNGAVSGIGEAITGEQGWTLGGAIFDATHDGMGQPVSYWDWVKKSWGIAPDKPAGPQASYDETERLARRYPAPVAPTVAQYDALGNYTGTW